jgi:S1-C subfamily serine protease
MAPVAAGPLKKRRRMTGMTWMFIGLLLFFIGAAAFTAIVSPSRRPEAPPIMRAAPRSEVGLRKLESTDGGVTFEDVEPPGSPADKAGLVGGDIITSFDGRPVREDDDILEILQEIPAGKTIDVVYVRDGVTKTAKLTTIERTESDRLAKAFINRPEGRGRFGYDDDQSERVQIEGTNTFGVRIDAITPSMPADLAGVKNGDIIIEFDGVPIRTPGELVSRVRRAIPYSTVKVVLMRGTEKLEIPVKMGR